MKMRRGSGPRTGSPSTSTSPRVALRKPPTMFRMVDLPHPDGPTRKMNSPRRTSRLIPARTPIGSAPALLGKVIQRSRIVTAEVPAVRAEITGSLVGVGPTDFIELLQLPNQQI